VWDNQRAFHLRVWCFDERLPGTLTGRDVDDVVKSRAPVVIIDSQMSGSRDPAQAVSNTQELGCFAGLAPREGRHGQHPSALPE
jgi:hypothetical protein